MKGEMRREFSWSEQSKKKVRWEQECNELSNMSEIEKGKEREDERKKEALIQKPERRNR